MLLNDGIISTVGKGRRRRDISFGVKTAKALDRYEVIRAQHRDAHLPHFWMGKCGGFGESGLRSMLDRRAEAAPT